MKSVQLNQTINFLYNQVFSITTRVLIQRTLQDYYSTYTPADTVFANAYSDFQTAIGSQSTLYAGQIYTNNFTPLTNLTYSTVSYPFPESLYPTAIPPTPPDDNRNTSAGQVLGPVSVPASPGLYALSFTIPIVNSNASSQPLILGYVSMIVSAAGLLRAVNDSTGMGQTGQTLVVQKNNSQYEVMLPPLRDPELFGQSFNLTQFPAVQLAFQNQTGYLIDTSNALGNGVSVGYTVFSSLVNSLIIAS